MYFDYAAATPIDPSVLKAMQPWLSEKFANPSSIYQSGQEARAAVDLARTTIASFLSARPTEIFFTASGTESCNWALRGVIEKRLMKDPKIHLIVTSIEHSSVLEMARYLDQYDLIEVTYLPVSREGIVDIEELKRLLRPETALISVMTVNNEIGTIQPIRDIGKLCRERGIYFHTDACQAPGWVGLDVNELGVDLLSMNASKISGPKGIGLLYIREGVQIAPWSFGGGQEFKMRAGTENVAGIVGFGKAVEVFQEDLEYPERVTMQRNALWTALQNSIADLHLNGSWEKRAGNNLNLLIKGVDGESVVRRLDLMGIAVSTGSACASGTVESSHVLMAIGRTPEEAKSCVRITLGKMTTDREVEVLVQSLVEVVTALRNSQ